MAIEQEKAKRQNKQTSKGIIKHSKDKREKIAVDNSTGTGIIKKDDSYLASFPELNINPILEVDNEGNLIYQNPACQRIFPDISTLCLKHPLFRDWHKVLRELQNAHPRQPVIRDISVGDSFYEQAYFAINNNRVRIYGRDITKRKKAEQSLKIAEENLRKSNEESPLGIRIVSKDGKTVFANHAVLDMFSYKNVEEFNTIPTEKSYNPESYTNSGMRLERQRRGESVPDSWEVNLGHKDGKVHHLQVFRSEVLWEGQLHDQRLYLDITDHKNAEQALQTTEENFRNSIENSPIGIRIVADDGETLYINQALLSMYGYKNLEEFKATPARSRYTPKSYLEFNERREKRLREEPLPNDYEMIMR